MGHTEAEYPCLVNCQSPTTDSLGFVKQANLEGTSMTKKILKKKCAMASFLCSWVTPGSIALAIKMATGNIVLDAE